MRAVLVILLSVLFFQAVAQENVILNFDFGGKKKGFYPVISKNGNQEKDGTIYRLYDTKVQLVKRKAGSGETNFLTSKTPFYFSLKVPEGNYRVTAVVGDTEGVSNTTIKAESRRLMVYDHTITRTIDTVSFIVNVRSAKINETDSILLKKREFDYLNWDEWLTLEFSGSQPCIGALTIEPVSDIPTIFLTGNSTVVDQDKEPWACWGQMFPLFLKPEVVVANFAESGETLKSFIREKRLQKISSLIKPGDYLFMEFAHNDQKSGANHVEPFTTYQEYLMKFVEFARENDAYPVLVTSTNRRVFDENGMIVNTLEEYPEAMRQLAKEENIALIDLNVMSKALYEALGPEDSKKAFVHYPANSFSWQEKALADDTHFNSYGAWQLAKAVTQAILESELPLKSNVVENFGTYNPNQPDEFGNWKWPVSQQGSSSKPAGY
ncbi:MAG: rhamnogalacturonan acetylesterase [Marinoscillum sp.]